MASNNNKSYHAIRQIENRVLAEEKAVHAAIAQAISHFEECILHELDFLKIPISDRTIKEITIVTNPNRYLNQRYSQVAYYRDTMLCSFTISINPFSSNIHIDFSRNSEIVKGKA